MVKLAIFASLLVSAAAFAPAQHGRTSLAVSASFENELGAESPLGFWDPIGVVKDGDQATFDRLRYVEIKHGRIAMLAVAGYLTTLAGYRFPGDIDYSGLKFADIPPGFSAFDNIKDVGLTQIIAFIGFLELTFMKEVEGKSEFIGDFRNGFIDFGWDKFDEETKMKKRQIELNQGRAAQMGILGLMVSLTQIENIFRDFWEGHF